MKVYFFVSICLLFLLWATLVVLALCDITIPVWFSTVLGASFMNMALLAIISIFKTLFKE